MGYLKISKVYLAPKVSPKSGVPLVESPKFGFIVFWGVYIWLLLFGERGGFQKLVVPSFLGCP